MERSERPTRQARWPPSAPATLLGRRPAFAGVVSVGPLYDLGVDAEPLRSFAAEVEQQYREWAERVLGAPDQHQLTDRMYM